MPASPSLLARLLRSAYRAKADLPHSEIIPTAKPPVEARIDTVKSVMNVTIYLIRPGTTGKPPPPISKQAATSNALYTTSLVLRNGGLRWWMVLYLAIGIILLVGTGVMLHRIRNVVSRYRIRDPNQAVIHLFSRAFRNPEAIIQAMAQSSTILSGPMALTVFLPWFVGQHLDWTFHTYHSPYCAGGMMQALSANGVVWFGPFFKILEVAYAAQHTIHVLHIDLIRAYIERATLEQATASTLHPRVEGVLNEIKAALDINPLTCQIRLSNDVYVCVVHGPQVAEAGAGLFNIIEGYSTITGQRVQIITNPQMSPLQHLFSYHASAVQCFVSAYCIGHAYYWATIFRLGYRWLYNRQHPISASAMAVKPQDSDSWRMFYPSWSLASTIRTYQLSTSWGSRFVRLSIPTGLDSALDEARAATFGRIMWQVSEGETRFVPVVPYSVRAVLQERRDKRVFTGRHVAAALQLALDHSVLFKPTKVYDRADEVSGV